MRVTPEGGDTRRTRPQRLPVVVLCVVVVVVCCFGDELTETRCVCPLLATTNGQKHALKRSSKNGVETMKNPFQTPPSRHNRHSPMSEPPLVDELQLRNLDRFLHPHVHSNGHVNNLNKNCTCGYSTMQTVRIGKKMTSSIPMKNTSTPCSTTQQARHRRLSLQRRTRQHPAPTPSKHVSDALPTCTATGTATTLSENWTKPHEVVCV